MDAIFSYQYYPIMKNVFKYLDLQSLLNLYEVSSEVRSVSIITFREIAKNCKLSDEEWFKILKIKVIRPGYYETQYKINLPEDFIDIFKEQLIKFDWLVPVIDYRTLSEDFVRRHFEYVNISKVCEFVKLSENFIREYKNQLCWEDICIYQDLSIDFIKEHSDLVHWKILIDCNKIPQEYLNSIMSQYKEEIENDYLYFELLSYTYDDFEFYQI